MNRLLLALAIVLIASCKTYPVKSCWGEVTHTVRGNRLECASYEAQAGKLVVPTDETCAILNLKPGIYQFSAQAVDCQGLESGFNEPVEFEVKGE